jgi:hypothetical protein
MKTTWRIKNVKKTTKDEEFTEITFKDYRGEWTVKLDEPRTKLLRRGRKLLSLCRN